MKVFAVFLVYLAVCYADNLGRYADNSGQYYHDDSGAYIPDNSGQYVDDGTGRYSGDNSGIYRDSIERYRHQGDLNGNGLGLNRNILPKSNLGDLSGSSTNVYAANNQYNNYNSKYNDDRRWKIIRQLSDIDTDGYRWEYETENKILAEESGKLYNKGSKDEALRAKGFFQYIGPDNVQYKIIYTADENGFVPQGAHIPTPPPIPAAIIRSLEYQRASNRL